MPVRVPAGRRGTVDFYDIVIFDEICPYLIVPFFDQEFTFQWITPPRDSSVTRFLFSSFPVSAYISSRL